MRSNKIRVAFQPCHSTTYRRVTPTDKWRVLINYPGDFHAFGNPRAHAQGPCELRGVKKWFEGRRWISAAIGYADEAELPALVNELRFPMMPSRMTRGSHLRSKNKLPCLGIKRGLQIPGTAPRPLLGLPDRYLQSLRPRSAYFRLVNSRLRGARCARPIFVQLFRFAVGKYWPQRKGTKSSWLRHRFHFCRSRIVNPAYGSASKSNIKSP